MHATVAGVVSAPIMFTTKLIPGLSAGRAFPFVGRALRIDPVRRLRTADIIDPVERTASGVRQGAETIGRTISKGLPF